MSNQFQAERDIETLLMIQLTLIRESKDPLQRERALAQKKRTMEVAEKVGMDTERLAVRVERLTHLEGYTLSEIIAFSADDPKLGAAAIKLIAEAIENAGTLGSARSAALKLGGSIA